MTTFLRAEWRFLALFTYAVPPESLLDLTPPGCAPEVRDGAGFVSLVGFRFERCRVLGIGWPGYTSFPEINLRYYLTRGGERGVGFIREYVPHRLTASLARALYNEPYVASPGMVGEVDERDDGVEVRYGVSAERRMHTFTITADQRSYAPRESTLEHALKEQSLGVGRLRSGAAISYQVRHPRWEIFPVRSSNVAVDFEALYGKRWSFLNDARPVNVMLARGSEITVSMFERERR